MKRVFLYLQIVKQRFFGFDKENFWKNSSTHTIWVFPNDNNVYVFFVDIGYGMAKCARLVIWKSRIEFLLFFLI